MAWVGTARARAKINLTLHILGRRADGYHDLESLVGFAAFGDDLKLTEHPSLSLTITGPNADSLGPSSDNHILIATRALKERKPALKLGAFHLTKRIPIAAGLGGGSADAAAALRLLARLNGLKLTDPDLRAAALTTGADVTVCLDSQARMMRGIGEDLGEPLSLPRLFAVLVNPRQSSSTPAVFQAIGLEKGIAHKGQPHPAIVSREPAARLLEALKQGRNDMQSAAIGLLPVIAEVEAALSALPDCRLARMSGSGATFFGLFDSCRSAALAAKRISQRHPEWWVKPTTID